MSTVNSIAFKYSAKGAKAVQRADKNVRNSVQETADTARRESGAINRWMERHKNAIRTIGVAALGAMAAIATASPTMRAELASTRMAFSLWADTIVNDVLPEGEGLADVAWDLESAYSDLDPAIREPLSALIFFGAFATAAAVGAGLLYGSIVGTGLLTGLTTLASGAYSAAAGILAMQVTIAGVPALLILLAAAAGVVGSELLGITDAAPIVASDMDTLTGMAADLGFFLGGPFVGLVLTGIAALTGGWSNARRVANRSAEEILKSSARFATRVHTGFLALGQGLRTVMELAWAYVKNEFKQGWNGLIQETINGVNQVIEHLNKLPEVDIDPVEFDPLDTKSTDQLIEEASGRMENRLQDLSNRANEQLKAHEPEEIRVLPENYGSEAAAQIQKEQEALQSEMSDTVASDVTSRERMLQQRFGRGQTQVFPDSDLYRGGSAPPRDGGQRVQTGDINVTVQGTGNTQEDGQRIAQEVSDEIRNQFGSRR